MSNKKQSSIDWLEQEFVKLEATVGVHSVMYELLEQAKAMHKEEITKTYDDAIMKGRQEDGNEYYNETFGGNNGHI